VSAFCTPKTMFQALPVVAALAIGLDAHASPAASVDPAVAPWKDVQNCLDEARGKVLSAKDARVGGKPGVTVVAKPDKGAKVLRSSIQGAKASDFPIGSDFCKLDFGAD
jgi:hypothetical protein